MSIQDADREQTLRRIGLAEDDAQALEAIWNKSEAFRLIADQRSASLAGWGYTAVDSLDAIWHELEEATAHLYMQHGFTPHQSFLLDTSTQAQDHLWGPRLDSDRVHQVLGSDLPRDLLVKLLLVAETPAEVAEFIASTDESGQPAEATVASIETRAAALPISVAVCDCQ